MLARFPLLTAAFLALSSGAYAQSAPPEQPSMQFIAFGAAMLPDYAGSDDYRVIPFGAVRLEFADMVIRTEGPGLAAELVQSGPVSAGVFARWSGGRDDVDDPVVSLLEEVDSSIIAGGFVDLKLAEQVLTPVDRISVGAKAGADMLGEFDGLAWSANLTYSTPISRSQLIALSASVSGYSDDYADRLFSIDGAGSAASGLPVYTAEGGVSDLAITGMYSQFLGEKWLISGVVGWSKLVGDYADSPIVTQRGSDDQMIYGLMLGRRF